MHRLALVPLALAALLSWPAKGEEVERKIAFKVYPFDVDRVRVEAQGAVADEVRWVAYVEPGDRRWTSGRGIVAYLDVVRDAPMYVTGEVRPYPGGPLEGTIGGRFTYDGDVHRLPLKSGGATP